MSTGAVKMLTDEQLRRLLVEITNKPCSGTEIQKAWEITNELKERGYKVDLILKEE